MLIVLDPGIESRIVDLGRPGTRSLGVPVGGAADRRSFLLGNSLIGNPPDAPALEVALKGPRLRADADTGCVVFGAPFGLWRDGYPLEVGRSFTLRAGEELRIGGTSLGVRAYLCVRGGFDAAAILDSRSALDRLHGGETLSCTKSNVATRWCPEVNLSRAGEGVLGVVPGLQADWFDPSEVYGQSFTVLPASNRMGVRLQGKPLTMPAREMISEPVSPGAIQVTNDGQCIVLGVDGQTIGGYPKIAHVIQADLDIIGQLRPGAPIRFALVSMDDAVKADRDAQLWLAEWCMRLRLSLDAFPGERRL
jgi:antagonist of KipI